MEQNTRYVNLKKEVIVDGKVVERQTVSFDLATTTLPLLGYFTSHGWEIVDYTDYRRF